MLDSPFARVATLTGGLIGTSALFVYFALGLSLGRPDGKALAGLPAASQEQARGLYSRVRWEPFSSTADMRLGEFFLANGRPATATAWLARATRWNNGAWQAWYYQGVAQRAMHRYADAEADFRKVLKLNPDYVAARYQSAMLLLDQGRNSDALIALSDLVRTGADQTRVAYATGTALLRQGRDEEAERAFSRAVTRFPAYGDGHAGLATALRGMGEQQEALHEAKLAQIYRDIVPLRTDDPLTEAMEQDFPTGRSLFQQAMRNRDPRSAVNTLQNSVALEPRMTNAWENLIALYGQNKQPREAEQAWSRLAKVDPGNVRGLYNLGVALGQSGERAKAAACFNQVLKTDPAYNEAHRMLGQLAELDGNTEEAARQFRIAFTNDAGFSEAHTDLGMLLLKSGNAKAAQEEFLRALLPPCYQPERTLVRELGLLRDQPVEQSFEDAVRVQAAQRDQPELITILNNRKKPAAAAGAIGLPGVASQGNGRAN
jgi:tetratricopeptide (TPR) repeat protein